MRGVPAPLTSLVGREREIETVRRLLPRARLLTLTGAGGSGKTRLAIEVLARESAAGHPVAWVELASVRDPALLPDAVLAALGVPDQGDSLPPAARLASAIGDRPILLALDNCEHLVEACAALADELLRGCRSLRVLATSREVLGVTGETAWLVPALSLPSGDLAAIEGSEAVQLFVDRARAVQPDFALGDAEQRRAVADICRRLDGLPLALELAAARLRTLTPRQIAARLDDRFRLLTTGNRAALPRHQTLRAAIDWSHDLLDPRGRRLLARLSVFDGGFTLEGAEQVCAGDALAVHEVLDVVSELVEKSLVQMNDAGDSARYRLLESVRQYAAERLAAAGELDVVRRRHAGFYLALVAEAEPHLTTAQRPRWVRRLEAELDNVRQALAWSRTGDEAMHVRLAGSLLWFWFATGHWPEAGQWFRSALATTAGKQPTRDRAAVLFAAGAIAALQARMQTALEHLDEAERLAAHDDPRLLAYIRNYRAMALSHTAPERIEEPLLPARAWARETGDLYALRLNYLLEATASLTLGDGARALAAAEEGVRIARVWGLERELAMALQVLGQIVMRLGDLPRARTLFRDALECLRRDPQPLFLARGLELAASCLVREGADAEATRVLGAAAAYREAIGAHHWKLDAELHGPTTAAARQALGDAAYEAAYAEGRTLDTETAIALAIETADRRAGDERPEPTTDTGEYRVVTRAATSPALRIRALGTLAIAIGHDDEPRAPSRHAKVRELLAVLALWPEGRTREQIGALLWPEASSAQVRNNFHVALHHLRRALGCAEWVAFERDRYRLDVPGGMEVDALTFEARVSAVLREARRAPPSVDALADAAALYRGPLLEGESVGDWHLELRDRLARLHLEVLEALADALLQRERWAEADDAYERLVAAEPLHEPAYRGVMRARAGLGDRAGVVRAFRRLESVLRRELYAEPEGKTVALLRELQRA